ncbi:MAG: hypothetical protein QXZ13_02580 [Candidatus Diapherotrites archaeon]
MRAQISTELLALVGAVFVISSLVAYFVLGSGLNTSAIEDTFPVITGLFGREKTVKLVKPTELEQVTIPVNSFVELYPEIITKKNPSSITYSILENGQPKQNCVLSVSKPNIPLNTRTQIKNSGGVAEKILVYVEGSSCPIDKCCLKEGYYDSKVEIVVDSKTYSDVQKKGVVSLGAAKFSVVYPTSSPQLTMKVGDSLVLTPIVSFNRPLTNISFLIIGKPDCSINVSNPAMIPSNNSEIKDSSGNVKSILIQARSNCSGVSGCCLTPLSGGGTYSVYSYVYFNDGGFAYHSIGGFLKVS